MCWVTRWASDAVIASRTSPLTDDDHGIGGPEVEPLTSRLRLASGAAWVTRPSRVAASPAATRTRPPFGDRLLGMADVEHDRKPSIYYPRFLDYRG